MDFSETIAASDLKVGRCRQLIEFMKICEYRRSRSFFTIYFPDFVCFGFTRPRYQVSVYRTIGPLAKFHYSRFVSIKISTCLPTQSSTKSLYTDILSAAMFRNVDPSSKGFKALVSNSRILNS